MQHVLPSPNLMNPTPAAAQQANTVAAALSGEKQIQTVQYAITGQPQVDCLAGIFAVLGQYPLQASVFFELLQMLANQYRRQAELEAKWQDQLQRGAHALSQRENKEWPAGVAPYTWASSGGSAPAVNVWPQTFAEAKARQEELDRMAAQAENLFQARQRELLERVRDLAPTPTDEDEAAKMLARYKESAMQQILKGPTLPPNEPTP